MDLAELQALQDQMRASQRPNTPHPMTSRPMRIAKGVENVARAVVDGFESALQPRNILNEINGGFEGANPVAVGRNAESSVPFGVIRGGIGEEPYVQVMDSVERIPLSQFTRRDWVSHIAEDGNSYIYHRSEDMNDPAPASVGRLLGFSSPGGAVPVVKSTDSALDAAGDAVGVSPALSMRGNAGAKTAGALESFGPTSGTVIRDNMRAAGEMGEAGSRIARLAGRASGPRDAGEALIEGANYFKQRTGDIGGKLFARVGRSIPKGHIVETPNSRAVLEDIIRPFADKPQMASDAGASRYAGYLDDLSSGMTWEQMSKFRSHLMEVQRGDRSPLSSIPAGDRKRLIAALTKDMGDSAEALGGEALSRWRNASNFWRERAEVVNGALKKILAKDATGEKVFSDTFAMLGDGSRANIRDISVIKRKLPSDAWGEVVSTVVERMGRATPGAQDMAGDTFSASTFLTNWNKISPEGKIVLFQGKGVPDGLRSQLDDLATLAEAAKRGGTEINNSRSGTVLTNVLTGGAAAGAVASQDAITMGAAGLGVLLSYAGAQMLTSPRIVRAMSTFGKTGDATQLLRLQKLKTPGAVELSNALRLAGVSSTESAQP